MMTCGRSALEMIAEEGQTIVLLDLLMTAMNGVLFLEELRKTHATLPVVVITGWPDSDLVQQAARYAPVMLIWKPVDPDLLRRTVQPVVGEEMSAEEAWHRRSEWR